MGSKASRTQPDSTAFVLKQLQGQEPNRAKTSGLASKHNKSSENFLRDLKQLKSCGPSSHTCSQLTPDNIGKFVSPVTKHSGPTPTTFNSLKSTSCASRLYAFGSGSIHKKVNMMAQGSPTPARYYKNAGAPKVEEATLNKMISSNPVKSKFATAKHKAEIESD